MWKEFTEHPVVAGIVSVFVVISAIVVFLAALANIWVALSHDTVPDFLAKQGWAMVLPPWQALLVVGVALAVVVLQVSILREAYRGPSPTMMIFTHKAAEGSIYASHIRDLFEKAGWRVELGRTDLPQHSIGVWLHGGTNFEREIAKWGLSRFGVSPQIDYKDDNPKCLQVIVGQLNVVQRNTGPKTESPRPSFPSPTVEMLEQARRELFQKRERLIADWRVMVTDVHAKSQGSKKRSVLGLLEEHPAFQTIRPYLTDEARAALWGRTVVVGPEQSTVSTQLHAIMNVIDEKEREWQLI